MELDELIAEIQALHREKADIAAEEAEAAVAFKARKREVRDKLAVLQDQLDAHRKVELANHALAVAKGEADEADVPDAPSRASVFAEMKG